MNHYVTRSGLHIEPGLCNFVETDALPGTNVSASDFWRGYANLLDELTEENLKLLDERNRLQRLIDQWHQQRRGREINPSEYKNFLLEIGYLQEDSDLLTIQTKDVDEEISSLAGPQLVVPVTNARFALNAANARWGSLYDALYGTDAILRPESLATVSNYDPARGAEVFKAVGAFLDGALPLAGYSHSEISHYGIADGKLRLLAGDALVQMNTPDAFVGHCRRGAALVLLFVHHGLHLELVVDGTTQAGSRHPAMLADVILEAALTTIQDLEDSVAAVDAPDKVAAYRNWLGLMKGDLVDTFEKNGKLVTRALAPDRQYTSSDGADLRLPGRSLMLVRNVGHLMMTDAVLDTIGRETPEGILDAMVTCMIALHDLRKAAGPRNSRLGSVYVVKPKMHGPREVKFANTVFDRVEKTLGLASNTIKLGIMDEERRTSLNLRACMRAARNRLVFINTGFLDRTGDEIHTSLEAGIVLPKGRMRTSRWLNAYEANNVDQGLAAGLPGKGQIGKGMWAKPDAMREMMDAKVAHPKAGATTAWVPSPTAATLHAMHYHQVDVWAVQRELQSHSLNSLDEMLELPLLGLENLSDSDVLWELENNAQSILGYVVRWIDQGIGCSKVPDREGVALMEDRATLRISSQHVANWLCHGLISRKQVMDAFERMAVVVDRQNAADPSYRPMAADFEGNIAFQTALELVFEGAAQPNGYTEPILHRRRREAKASRS